MYILPTFCLIVVGSVNQSHRATRTHRGAQGTCKGHGRGSKKCTKDLQWILQYIVGCGSLFVWIRDKGGKVHNYLVTIGYLLDYSTFEVSWCIFCTLCRLMIRSEVERCIIG